MVTIHKGTKQVSIKPKKLQFGNQRGGEGFFQVLPGGGEQFFWGPRGGGAEDFLRLKRKARSLFFRFQLLGH